VRLFEVSDVVLKDDNADVGASNHRRLIALYSAQTASFEVRVSPPLSIEDLHDDISIQIIHGLLDRIMQMLDVKRHATQGYTLKPSDGASACCLFFPSTLCISMVLIASTRSHLPRPSAGGCAVPGEEDRHRRRAEPAGPSQLWLGVSVLRPRNRYCSLLVNVSHRNFEERKGRIKHKRIQRKKSTLYLQLCAAQRFHDQKKKKKNTNLHLISALDCSEFLRRIAVSQRSRAEPPSEANVFS
jgi:hypothetical protein